MSVTWPLEVFNVLTLTEKDGKTILRLKGAPINATEEEIETFRSEFEGMNKGFSETFDQLEEYLSKL
jgi:fibrillarin-like rRNA methylase